jgi:hypothetical protein
MLNGASAYRNSGIMMSVIAKVLGITIPQSVLLRAVEVIQ